MKAPLDMGIAVLPAEAEIGALDPEGGLRDQRRRRTDEQFGRAGFPRVRRLPDRVDLDQGPGKAVHLPISGDQRPYARGHSGLSATLIGGCYHRPPPLQSRPFAYAKHSSAAREGALVAALGERGRLQKRLQERRKGGYGEMLESMRNASQGVVGKAIMTIVMGLIIVSFVIWGVGDMLRGFSPSTVASVGGAKISAQDYHVAYDRAIQQYQRRLRRPFTNEEARQVGLDRSVLQQLLSEAAVDDEAGKLGLGISDEALREVITSNPSFQRQVRRLRSEPPRRSAARHGYERARLHLGIAQAGLEAVHRLRALDRHHRAQGRGAQRKPTIRARRARRIISSSPLRRRGTFPRPLRMRSKPSTTIASRAIARPNTGR